MNNMVVHFGGGALGRGLVIPLLHESKASVVLVDTNEFLLDKLKKTLSYTLDISDDPSERLHHIPLQYVVSSITDKERLIYHLKTAKTITTSVRRENLIHIVKCIADVWKDLDCEGRCVICCENVENVGKYFRELLLQEAKSENERINLEKVKCPDTIVDRICATTQDDNLQITSEVFYECSVDKKIIEDTGLSCIHSVENIRGHFYRKRYLLNAFADSLSFVGKARNKKFLYEAIRDKEINEISTPFMKLLMELLYIRYQIPLNESEKWLSIYQKRLSNENIPRELSTVARNLWTKLTLEERFVQPLLELKQSGIDVKKGLKFIAILIQSEQMSCTSPLSKTEVLHKLEEYWCIHPLGKEMYEEFCDLYDNTKTVYIESSR